MFRYSQNAICGQERDRKARIGKRPEYLTTDCILGIFNSKRGLAQNQFRAFIREGMNGETPWEELRG